MSEFEKIVIEGALSELVESARLLAPEGASEKQVAITATSLAIRLAVAMVQANAKPEIDHAYVRERLHAAVDAMWDQLTPKLPDVPKVNVQRGGNG